MAAHLVYENLRVNPVVARLKKLTIMQMCRMRCRRVKRTNWRSSPSSLGSEVLVTDGFSKIPPSGIGPSLAVGRFRRVGIFLFVSAQFPAHLESPGQPEQRMNAADHERSHQQAGHSPEGVEDERILFGVVVGGVRQVTGKAPVRTLVALAAGGRHVGPAEVRARIRHLKDVMGSMAVVALGGFGIAKFRDLPVIGIKISLGDVLVAASAGGHHIQPETVLIGAVDGVSGVAIVANWKWLAVAADAFGMDAVLKLLLNAVVTLSTGVGNVVGIDARCRIGSGEDMVRGMATGAGCRHRQSILEQRSMNALGVVGDNLVMVAGVAHGSFLALAVTTGAQAWDVDGKG